MESFIKSVDENSSAEIETDSDGRFVKSRVQEETSQPGPEREATWAYVRLTWVP